MDLTVTKKYFNRKMLNGKYHVFCRTEISPRMAVEDIREFDTEEAAIEWEEGLNLRVQNPEKVTI